MEKFMKIFLTGATGLLGSHLLEQGLENGHEFIIPYRKITKRHYLNDFILDNRITTIEMDLMNDIDVNLLNEIDVIINSAAFASPFEKDYDQMVAINTELPKRLYKAGKKADVAKFIQISSTSVLGSEESSKTLTEEDSEYMRDTPYAKTKKAADDWLWDKTDVATIHPGFMLDRYDSRPSSGAILMALKMKKFNVYINGIKNIVAASDVAKGIYQLLEAEKFGNYILGGENISIANFLKIACEKIGKEFSELQEITEDQLIEHQLEREFCLTSPVSSDKAKNDFGYVPVHNIEQCLDNTLEWFQEKKMMRVKK
ncbi:MAG: NAD(P)-dependent oxidoreductase [Deltaproteobacteria bacterium]|nr:MAG: NAD(P)-dependent oxidoreductase [Deltaproteobacteria bacterium]